MVTACCILHTEWHAVRPVWLERDQNAALALVRARQLNVSTAQACNNDTGCFMVLIPAAGEEGRRGLKDCFLVQGRRALLHLHTERQRDEHPFVRLVQSWRYL